MVYLWSRNPTTGIQKRVEDNLKVFRNGHLEEALYKRLVPKYRSLGNFRGIKFSRVIISCDNIFVVWVTYEIYWRNDLH